MNKVQLPSSSFRIYERVENKGRNVNVNGKIKLFCFATTAAAEEEDEA